MTSQVVWVAAVVVRLHEMDSRERFAETEFNSNLVKTWRERNVGDAVSGKVEETGMFDRSGQDYVRDIMNRRLRTDDQCVIQGTKLLPNWHGVKGEKDVCTVGLSSLSVNNHCDKSNGNIYDKDVIRDVYIDQTDKTCVIKFKGNRKQSQLEEYKRKLDILTVMQLKLKDLSAEIERLNALLDSLKKTLQNRNKRARQLYEEKRRRFYQTAVKERRLKSSTFALKRAQDRMESCDGKMRGFLRRYRERVVQCKKFSGQSYDPRDDALPAPYKKAPFAGTYSPQIAALPADRGPWYHIREGFQQQGGGQKDIVGDWRANANLDDMVDGKVNEDGVLNEEATSFVKRMMNDTLNTSENCEIRGVDMLPEWHASPSGKKDTCILGMSNIAVNNNCHPGNIPLYDPKVVEDMHINPNDHTCVIKFKEGTNKAEIENYNDKVDILGRLREKVRKFRAEIKRLNDRISLHRNKISEKEEEIQTSEIHSSNLGKKLSEYDRVMNLRNSQSRSVMSKVFKCEREKGHSIYQIHANRLRSKLRDCRQFIKDDLLIHSPQHSSLNASTHWANDWDGSLDWVVRDKPIALTRIYSVHANQHEDRRFKFAGVEVNDKYLPSAGVQITEFVNDWDDRMDFNVPDNCYVVGLKSHHWNDKEDRRWKIYYRRFKKDGMISSKNPKESNQINDYDDRMDFRVPDGHLIVGFYSWHKNKHEDRRWKVRYAELTLLQRDGIDTMF